MNDFLTYTRAFPYTSFNFQNAIRHDNIAFKLQETLDEKYKTDVLLTEMGGI